MKAVKKFDFHRIGQAIVNNLWLKMVSLFLAVLLWLYLSSEILKGVRI
jgi:hypothetical protein